MSGEVPGDMQKLVDENNKIEAYLNANLRPIVRTYVRNYCKQVTNAKCWRLCDMWFTAFLVGSTGKMMMMLFIGT